MSAQEAAELVKAYWADPPRLTLCGESAKFLVVTQALERGGVDWHQLAHLLFRLKPNKYGHALLKVHLLDRIRRRRLQELGPLAPRE